MCYMESIDVEHEEQVTWMHKPVHRQANKCTTVTQVCASGATILDHGHIISHSYNSPLCAS